jgi:hypothetical protein
MITRHIITYSFDSAILGVAINAVIAFFAIAVWFVYRRQLATMNETLEESRRNNRITEEDNTKLLDQSSKSALAALDSACRSNESTEESNKIARQSLEESKRSFETSQRARLAVREFEFGDVTVGPLVARAHIINTGPLGATEVRTQAYLLHGKDADSARLNDMPPAIRHDSHLSFGKDFIGNGAVVPVEAHLNLDQAIINSNVLMFIGRVQYLDGFGNDRTLRFCRYWNKGNHPESWHACFRHNWAD